MSPQRVPPHETDVLLHLGQETLTKETRWYGWKQEPHYNCKTMRVKKPGFLKVFERSGEKDNCPLLDLGGDSMHGDEQLTHYVAPPSMGADANQPNQVAGNPESAVATAQQETKSWGEVEKNQNSRASRGERNKKSGPTNRIGELAVKPRPINDAFVRSQDEPHRGFSGSQTNEEGKKVDHRKEKDEPSSSSSSEEDYYFQAAVTTQNGDDDADTFVQFTLETVKPGLAHQSLGPVHEDEEDARKSELTEDNEKPTWQNSVGKPTLVRYPSTELMTYEGPTQSVNQTERPRLARSGKSPSKRNLAKQGSLRALLEKDKPSVDEEVQKLLNLKTRPGLGGRKQSERSLRKGRVQSRQSSKRNLLKKAASERGLGTSSEYALHKESEHSMTTVTTENKHTPLFKSELKESTPPPSQKRGRPVIGERSRLMTKAMSMQVVTERVQTLGMPTTGFVPQEEPGAMSHSHGETALSAPSLHAPSPKNLDSSHFSNHVNVSESPATPSDTQAETPKEISGAETDPLSTATDIVTKAQEESVTVPRLAVKGGDQNNSEDGADRSGKSDIRKSNDSPESPRRIRQQVPKSPVKSPSRKTRKEEGSMKSVGTLPSAPLSPSRRTRPSKAKANRRPRTSGSKSSQSNENVVISWSRSPKPSSPTNTKKQSMEPTRPDHDDSAKRTRQSRTSRSTDSPPKEGVEFSWVRSPESSKMQDNIASSSNKLFVSQQCEVGTSPLRETKDSYNDDLVELTDGEEEQGKETEEPIAEKEGAKSTTPGVFVSSLLGSAPPKTSDRQPIAPQPDGNGNVMVGAQQTEISKDFSKGSKSTKIPCDRFEQKEQESLLRYLEETKTRLEDARRLVSKLEGEMARLTREMQSCDPPID